MVARSGSGAGSAVPWRRAPTRELAAAALVVLVAVVAWRTGDRDRPWEYVAVAAALLPQLVVDVLSLAGHHLPEPSAPGDPGAAGRAGAARRSRPLLAVAALLAVTGPALLVLGHAPGPALASLTGAAGISFAAGAVGPRRLAGTSGGRDVAGEGPLA